MRTALIIGLLLFSCLDVGAVELSFATPATGEPVMEVAGALSELSGTSHSLEVSFATHGGSARQVWIHLVHASLPAQRQALAFALGSWWVRPPGAQESTVYGREPTLPHGHLSSTWTTSGLVGRADLEVLVRSLMAPWLSGDAGLAYQADEGSWPSSLDAAGRMHLVQLLDLLERPHACCPDLLPDPDQPDLNRTIAAPLAGGTWGALAANLSSVAGMSIALGPDLPPSAAAPEDVHAGSVLQAVLQLQASGVQVGLFHGVLCLGRQPVEDGEHPAQRRRLAMIPIAHLVRSPAEGELVSDGLLHLVTPKAWTQPGWGLHYLDAAKSLIAAADPEHLHLLLDALDTIDQLGLEEGMRTLAAQVR